MSYPECDKWSSHSEEWNHITRFFEWLGGMGIFLSRHESVEEAMERTGYPRDKVEAWVFPYPIALGRAIGSLLYEYFGVDPAKLEQERRRMLDGLDKK